MKMIYKALLASLAMVVVSCAKEGLGGDATLIVFLQHHTHTIVNHIGYPDTVYIKFKATEFPGPHVGDYDTYFIGKGHEDHVNCKGLKWGDYYIYATGYDSTGPFRVVGGMHIKIKRSDRKKEFNVNLPVLE